jgi:hypothetical protein
MSAEEYRDMLQVGRQGLLEEIGKLRAENRELWRAVHGIVDEMPRESVRGIPTEAVEVHHGTAE